MQKELCQLYQQQPAAVGVTPTIFYLNCYRTRTVASYSDLLMNSYFVLTQPFQGGLESKFALHPPLPEMRPQGEWYDGTWHSG